jgi:tetratricopeptide (TPR) repeat protein
MKLIFVKILPVLALMTTLLSACASTGNGSGVSLQDAIVQTAQKITKELPPDSRVAIVAFESENANLSDYIIEELTGELFDFGIEVADRQNMPFVYKELDFQMSGDISDESARSIGKFLAADCIIIGKLLKLRNGYRYDVSAVNEKKATRSNVFHINVRNDSALQNMIAALSKQKAVTTTARYGVSERITPKTAGTYLDRGIMFAVRKEFELAIEDFTDAIRLNPDLSNAYSLRGRAYLANGALTYHVEDGFSDINYLITGWKISAEQIHFFDQAIADYTQAIKLDPNNARIYYERSSTYHAKEDYDKAIADSTQAIRINPNFGDAYNLRGMAYEKKNDYDKAIADYTQALKLKPKANTWYSNRGNAYSAKGDHERAIADYNQAISLASVEDAILYYNRGLTYSDKGDYDRAIKDLTKAIELSKDKNGNSYFMDAYLNRGAAYLNMGDDKKAIADFTRVIEIKPDHIDAYINRGFCHSSLGDFDKAISDYESALRLDPNDTMTRNNIEAVRRKRGY